MSLPSLFTAFSQFMHSTQFRDLACHPGACNAFVRKRKLPLPALVAVMLSGMRKSVQTELDEFFAHLKEQAQLVHHVSEQAFAKAAPSCPPQPSRRLTTGSSSAPTPTVSCRAGAAGGSSLPTRRPCVSGAVPATSRAPPVPTKSPLAFTCPAPK